MKNLAFIIGIVLPAFILQAQVSFITNGQQINNLQGNDVQFEDFNNDGFNDAFVVNLKSVSGEGHRVYLNDGTGIFTDNGQELIDAEHTSLNAAIGDINNDGIPDVITGSTIWLNNGDGQFEADTFAIDIGDYDCWGIVNKLEDLNDDGYPDLFCVFEGEVSIVKVFLNNGTGHFINTGQLFGGGAIVKAELGDIDNDGDIDAITAGWKSNTNYCPNRIWLNDGNGTFAESAQVLDQGGRHIHDIKLGDIDTDGDMDLVMGITSSPYIQVYRNDGSGNFNTGQSFGNVWVSSFDLGDLNSDGSLDLLFVSGDCSVLPVPVPGQVWLNDGAGYFTDSKTRIGNDISSDVKLADLNNDHRLDAFVVNWDYDGDNQCGRPADIWLNIPFACNYLGETTPGKTPLLFGSGTVSVANENTHSLVFYPDGKSLFFSRYPERKSYTMNFEDSAWSAPVEAVYDGKETSISTGGDKLFYYKGDGDIFYRDKTIDGWSGEVNAGTNINTEEMEYFPSITNDGTLFFSRNGNWDQGRVLYSRFTSDEYNTPVDIGLPVNSQGALHAYVSPDKSYMLFNSPRTGSYTNLDIWISYRNQNGSWTNPKNVGEIINSGSDAILCPTVTPDGKYMFFTKLTHSSSTGNIYWVSTEFVDSLKNANFVPYVKTEIPDQTGEVGIPFNFNLPANTFIDDDGNNTLTYRVELTNGNPLPEWVTYNEISQAFSVEPTVTETLNIRVSVTDSEDAVVFDDFNIIINPITNIKTQKQTEVLISPNPAKNELRISTTNSSLQINTYQLTNINGKVARQSRLESETIDISGLPKGIFILNLHTNEGIISKKVVVE